MIENPHAMLPIAYRAASRILTNPVMAAEASERAVHKLTLAVLHGAVPERPDAWLRVVAHRSACALLRSDWGRMHAVASEQLATHQAPYRRPQDRGADLVRERLAGYLTLRQQQVLDAAMTCNGTRAAARCCGMQPRDFRRSINQVSRKARELLGGLPATPARDDDPAVQFTIAT